MGRHCLLRKKYKLATKLTQIFHVTGKPKCTFWPTQYTEKLNREFSGDLVVRIPHFHCTGLDAIPNQETEILQAAWYSQKVLKNLFKMLMLDFHGDTVDGNPPASAGDAGSIPGQGRIHIPGSSYPMCHSY